MRTRCPNCGTTLSLDALVAHDAAREALALAFRLSGQIGGALVRYLALFRPDSRELTMDRVARLLNDVLPDIQAQRIQRNGQLFDAPTEAWIWAIEQALAARDAGRLTTPLKSHGWLYEVISNWRPAPGQVVGTTEQPSQPRGSQSQMLAGLSLLEEMKRGGRS
ncbi:hypothetical protein [Chitiniphilus shinanonensis]|uniref:hypothetical protein n=1 Tax=Chitiniphilus shinanonensis TaxID=553088 RepID=UPI00302EF3B3